MIRPEMFHNVQFPLCFTHEIIWPFVVAVDDEPDPTEIFTVVILSDTKIAIKSGYGRYLGVDTAGEVVGKAEAVGPREQWEPVFEEVGALSGEDEYISDRPTLVPCAVALLSHFAPFYIWNLGHCNQF